MRSIDQTIRETPKDTIPITYAECIFIHQMANKKEIRVIFFLFVLMNVKRFLSDSYRRSIDQKINSLILNRKVTQYQKEVNHYGTQQIKSSHLPSVESGDLNQAVTLEDAIKMYNEKCSDMKIKPNKIAQNRFTEQFINSFGKKSIKFSGLGLGPGCVFQLIKMLGKNAHFKTIDLSLNRISDQGAIFLGQYLSNDPEIIYLDLRSNAIESQGCIAVFRGLMNNHHLTELDLSAVDGIERNKIGTLGCKELARLFTLNDTLSSINLSMCGITSEGCQHLGPALSRNSSLATLDLTANRFGSIGAIELFQHSNSFGELTTLVLSRNGIDDEASSVICSHLTTNTSLRSLDLSDNNFGLGLVRALCDVFVNGTKITSLSLAKNNLGPETADFIGLIVSNAPSLQSFDISLNPFKDKGCSDIVHSLKLNTTLISLNMSDTMLSDMAAVYISEVISTHPSLSRLYLSSNTITDKGGVLIAKALENNSILTYLSLKNNELKDLTSEALIVSFKKNCTLADIDLSYNDFGYRSYVQLMKVIDSHKRALSSNVATLALKHIDFLKEEEQKLFKYRDDIVQREFAVADAEEQSKTKNDEFIETKARKEEEIRSMEKELEYFTLQYQEVSNKRRQLNEKLKHEKSELEKKQKEANEAYQTLLTINQQLTSRLEKLEQKKLDERIAASRKKDELQDQLEQAKLSMKNTVKEILENKRRILEEARSTKDSSEDTKRSTRKKKEKTKNK